MNSIIERVQTIEDAYKEAGVTESDIVPYKDPVDADQRAVNAFAKAQFITRVLNDGREPENGWWWEIWWWMKDPAGGPGFSFRGVHCDRSYSRVGARLRFVDRATAEHAADKFFDIYKEFMAPVA